MNKKISALLTMAIMTGLIASQAVKAEESTTQKAAGDQMSAEKNGCKGQKTDDKNSCNGKSDMKKKKKSDKNSCKNGCGESKEKKDETKQDK